MQNISRKNQKGSASARLGRDGFTLIEILVVIGIIAVLAAIVIIAINPARQFAQARNSQRTSNVNAILNAVGQNIADHKGVFECTYTLASGTAVYIADSEADIHECIVPDYMPETPYDPGNPSVFGPLGRDPHVDSSSDYDTGYTIFQDGGTQRITICAPGGVEPAISGSGAICVTR